MTRAAISPVQVAASTSSGIQTIPIPCEGYTPKGAMIEIFPNTVAGEPPVDHARGHWGYTDGTTHLAGSHRDQDAQSTTSTGRRTVDGAVVELLNTNNNNQQGAASFSSFGADELRINWTNPPAVAILMNVIAWYGDDLEVAVVEHATSGILDDENFISGLSFAPNGLRCFSLQRDFGASAGVNQLFTYHGCAVNNMGTTEQWSVSGASRNGLTIDSGVGDLLRNDSILANVAIDPVGAATFNQRAQLTTWASDGVGITQRNDPTALNGAYFLFRWPHRLSAVTPDLETATTGTGSGKTVNVGFDVAHGCFIGTSNPVS